MLLVAYGVWRWRSLEFERKAILVLAVLALAVYASGVLSALPDPKELIGDIAEALGAWTYLLVGIMAFLETGAFVGLIAPGETVVIAGGVIAGPGRDRPAPADRAGLGLRGARRHHELLHRPAPRPELPGEVTARG